MIYGFFAINKYALNGITPNQTLPQQVNTIGDIQNKGLTYSRDLNSYISNSGILYIFDVGTLTNEQQAVVKTVNKNLALLLDNTVNYNTSSGSLLTDLEAVLGTGITSLTLGASIISSVDEVVYPSSMTFTFTNMSYSWNYKIWLSNSNFLAEYPLGEFNLITPVTNLLTLYNNYNAAKADVDNSGVTDLINMVNTQMSGIALTGIASFSLKVFNINDTTEFFDLPIIVPYTAALACTQYNFFNSFKNQLLSLGTMTIDDWVKVIPELIPLDEYYIKPNWKNTALADMTVVSGFSQICSPTISALDPVSFHTKYFPDYDLSYISAKLNYTVAMYKSIGLLILPNSDNVDSGVAWGIQFQDYFLVPSTDQNALQMSANTQAVVAMLDQLIRYAETYVLGTYAPIHTTIEIHNGLTYLTQYVNTTKLAVLTRASELTVL